MFPYGEMTAAKRARQRHQLLFRFFYSLFKRGAVNIAGEMNRALPVDRIPAGGVGRTVKLRFEAHADNGFGGF